MEVNTNTIDDVAIDDSIAEINTCNAAKKFIQTIISKFHESYTIENPDNVRMLVGPVVRALQGLQRKGYNMRPYAYMIVAAAAEEFKTYAGHNDALAHESTLIVTDQMMHKRGTGYWKKSP